jgi:hypothetical protein
MEGSKKLQVVCCGSFFVRPKQAISESTEERQKAKYAELPCSELINSAATTLIPLIVSSLSDPSPTEARGIRSVPLLEKTALLPGRAAQGLALEPRNASEFLGCRS